MSSSSLSESLFKAEVGVFDVDSSQATNTSISTGRIAEILGTNSSVRTFSYITGALAPPLSRDSPWYLYFAFIWSWSIRLLLVSNVVLYILYISSPTYGHNTNKILFFSAGVMTFMQTILIVVLMYVFRWKKWTYAVFKSDPEEKPLVDVTELLSGVYKLIAFYLLILAISGGIYTTCAGCPGNLVAFIELVPSFLFESYVYFALSHDLKYIESLVDRELLEPASADRLTADHFSAIRSLIEHRSESHIVAYSLFSVVTFISLITFLLDSYLLSHGFIGAAIYEDVFIVFVFDVKDMVFMFLILWKITGINEKSRKLSLLLEDRLHNKDNGVVLMKQIVKPVMYKLFGISLFRNEFLLSLLGYIGSLIGTAVQVNASANS